MRLGTRIVISAAILCGTLLALTTGPRPATSQTPAASRPAAPAYAHGSPDNMTVYLDFGDRLAGGGVAVSDDEVFTLFARVAEKLCPTLGVTVTTVVPDQLPGEYVTVRFLSSYVVPWRDTTIGHCPRKMIFNTSWHVPNVVYVARQEPYQGGAVAAHEVVHCLQPDGFSHEEAAVGSLPNLMAARCPPGGILSPNMALVVTTNVAQLWAGWRLGAYLRDNGTWFFDWHTIGG
ncbi:MAG TPA: hypothetical protein VMZ71_02350 [Gemmataceae bacterium]|nr:hypothetical protein [Gemmataceae bacterium]